MKTATVQEAKDRWVEIFGWVAAGEEVQVTSKKNSRASGTNQFH